MKKNLLSIFLLLSTLSYSQKVDIGLMAAGTHYYGDVVNEFEPTTIRFAAAGFIRYRLNNFFAVKAMGLMGKVSGDDKLSQSVWQQQRNWNFETLILEGSAQLEWNLLEDRNTARKLVNPLIPYVFLGVGAFYFKPQSEINNGERLQSTAPLMLSGVKYNQIAVAIPLGLGFRYYLNKKWLVGGEFGLRYTTTSYIDDIGNFDRHASPETTPVPKATRYFQNRQGQNHNTGDYRGKMGQGFNINDIYTVFGANIAYNFNKSKGKGIWQKKQGCPRFF
jgi:hypothetical protein